MSDPPHIWDALRAVHSPKTLVDIINTLTNIPSETPERWIIVKSFFSKRVSSLAHLADMEWMKLVVRNYVSLVQGLSVFCLSGVKCILNPRRFSER